jgi:histidine triad (HIT) family protein
VHVFPRTADDRFHLEIRWQKRSRAALDDDATQVRAALNATDTTPDVSDDSCM